jgi:hypothetical protein
MELDDFAHVRVELFAGFVNFRGSGNCSHGESSK